MARGERELKDSVREHYGKWARQSESTAMESRGSQAAATVNVIIYDVHDLAGLPKEAIGASAGSGNPTALANLQSGETVLDLGSGGGIDCFLAARNVGETGMVYGLDMTPDMVELARRNVDRLGVKNVEFLLGEIEEVPLPDNSVDVVLSNCVICLSPDKDAVFSQAFRVLRPGGRLHVSDVVSRQEIPDLLREDKEAWASCVTGADSHSAYLDRLSRAGFVDVQLVEERVLIKEQYKSIEFFSARVTAYKPS